MSDDKKTIQIPRPPLLPTTSTPPSVDVLSELVRLGTKADGARDAAQRAADVTGELIHRIRAVENDVQALKRREGQNAETARAAMQSAHDLEAHLVATEAGMRATFDNLAQGLRKDTAGLQARVEVIDKAMGAQTTLLEQIIKKQTDAEDKKVEADKKRSHTVALIAVLAPIIIAALATLGTYFVQRNVSPVYAQPTYQTLPQSISGAK